MNHGGLYYKHCIHKHEMSEIHIQGCKDFLHKKDL